MEQQQPDGPGQTSCELFPRLPLEIVHLICAFACKTTSSSPFPHIDYRAIRTIALVSKAFNKIAIPILYGNVTLSRPSDLRFYARTVTANPSLGKETRTLWIGATSKLLPPKAWWPLVYEPCTMIRSSITDPKLLPHDVPVARYWPVSHSSSGQWAEEEVIKVLQEACKTVGSITGKPGVDLNRQEFVIPDGEPLSRDEWILRIFEVQEALDEYLEDLRTRQDKSRSTKAMVDLAINQGRNCIDASSSDYFRSEFEQVTHKLRDRPDLDRFEHPLIYARSGSSYLLWGALPQPIPFADPSINDDAAYANLRVPIEYVYTFATLERCRLVSQPSMKDVLLRKPLFSTLVASVQRVLLFSPNVTSLALTGSLEGVFMTGHACPSLPPLRVMSLGPVPPQWNRGCRFMNNIRTLEELHISGRKFFDGELIDFSSKHGPLPGLKKIYWNWWPLQRNELLLSQRPNASADVRMEDIVQTLGLMLCYNANGPAKHQDWKDAVSFHLIVNAHHEDVAYFRSTAHPDLINHPRLTMKVAKLPPADGTRADDVGDAVDGLTALNMEGNGNREAQAELPAAAEDLDPSSDAARLLTYQMVEARWEESIRVCPP